MSLAESQEFFALNPDDLSGLAEQDRSGGPMVYLLIGPPTLYCICIPTMPFLLGNRGVQNRRTSFMDVPLVYI